MVTLILGAGVALPIPAKAADPSVAQTAFASGDYNRAEQEWKALAAQDAAQAAYGLGQVYEEGRGDYRKAIACYADAARRGAGAAKYRLALIEAAGNETTAPDLVEAYKWAVLATEAADAQWARLAGELRRLIEANLGEQDQRRARAEAEQWLSAPQSADECLPPPPRPAEVEVSAQNGAVAMEVPRNPPEPAPPPSAPKVEAAILLSPNALREELAKIDCARLRTAPGDRGTMLISGTVPGEAERAELERLAARLGPAVQPEIRVDIVPKPLCNSLAAIDLIRSRAADPGNGLDAHLVTGAAPLRDGEPIRLEVTAAARPVYLRIDYFTLNGKVYHLLPNPQQKIVRLDPGLRRIFGGDHPGEDWTVAEPFGTELILVTATPQPLDFWPPRPDLELAKDYLTALGNILGRGPSPQSNALAAVLIHTRPR